MRQSLLDKFTGSIGGIPKICPGRDADHIGPKFDRCVSDAFRAQTLRLSIQDLDVVWRALGQRRRDIEYAERWFVTDALAAFVVNMRQQRLYALRRRWLHQKHAKRARGRRHF